MPSISVYLNEREMWALSDYIHSKGLENYSLAEVIRIILRDVLKEEGFWRG